MFNFIKFLQNPKTQMWHERFFNLAQHVSTWSNDSSTKVGCAIVDNDHNVCATGYNGYPRGYESQVADLRDIKIDKYMLTEHAERNAIYQASRRGIKLKGCSLYSTLFPCADCARAIIQSGIQEVIAPSFNHQDTRLKHWSESIQASERMFSLCKILVIDINELIDIEKVEN